jgi:hypothetical protein
VTDEHYGSAMPASGNTPLLEKREKWGTPSFGLVQRYTRPEKGATRQQHLIRTSEAAVTLAFFNFLRQFAKLPGLFVASLYLKLRELSRTLAGHQQNQSFKLNCGFVRVKYEAALKTDQFLLIALGTAAEVAKVKDIIDNAHPLYCTLHTSQAVAA